MAKHSLSLREQAAGIQAALASKRTPNRLRPALRRRLNELEQALKKKSRKLTRSPKFVGWIEF
jgi:hypothetical protein